MPKNHDLLHYGHQGAHLAKSWECGSPLSIIVKDGGFQDLIVIIWYFYKRAMLASLKALLQTMHFFMSAALQAGCSSSSGSWVQDAQPEFAGVK